MLAELDMTVIGLNIRRIRQQRGMKTSTLAFEAGYNSVSMVSDIERGRAVPSLEKLLAMARVLQVPPEALLPSQAPVSAMHYELVEMTPKLPLALVTAFVLVGRSVLVPSQSIGATLEQLCLTVRQIEATTPCPR